MGDAVGCLFRHLGSLIVKGDLKIHRFTGNFAEAPWSLEKTT